MASVLPPRRSLSASSSPRGGHGDGSNGIVAESSAGSGADDHERELIVMLEQKHGKVRGGSVINNTGQDWTLVDHVKVCRPLINSS